MGNGSEPSQMFEKVLNMPVSQLTDIWVNVFENGPSNICGRQTLTKFTWPILEYIVPCMRWKHWYRIN